MNETSFATDIREIDGLPSACIAPIEKCFDDACTLFTQKIDILEDQLRKANRVIFGKKSERYDVQGQTCMNGIADEKDNRVAATLDAVLKAMTGEALDRENPPAHVTHAHNEADKKRGTRGSKKKTSGGGRVAFPAGLEERKRRTELDEADRLDEHGHPLPCIGFKTTQTLGYQRAQFYLDTEERALYGKPFDEETPRIVTPSTNIYEKSSFSNALIAFLVHAKFHDHLPMYRIEQHLEVAGLDNWKRQKLSRGLIHVALLKKIRAVCDAINAEILAQPVVHIDDTTCPMLNPGTKKCLVTRLWAVTNGKNAWYHHSLTRSGAECLGLLENYTGHILCDDCPSHNGMFLADERDRAACMAHIRRKFMDIKGDAFAESLVLLIQSLYDIERYLQAVDLSDNEKVDYRYTHARPILIHMYTQLDNATCEKTYTPKSDIGKAIFYATRQRAAMFEYLEHGYLEIDNNNCERAMRRIALGRKNYLFIGSEDGGTSVATWCTIVETCRRHLIHAETYLNWLFTKLKKPGKTHIDYALLTPSAYAAQLRQLEATNLKTA